MLAISIVVFTGSFLAGTLLLLALNHASLVPAKASVTSDRPKRRRAVADVRKVVRFSAIPWMNRLLQKMELAPKLRLLIYQAESKWSVGQLVLMCLACGVVPYYLCSLRIGSRPAALGIGIASSFIPFGFLMFRRSQRFARFEEELPKALDLIVAALRAGHSFNAALGLAGREASEPVRSEFKLCFDEQNYGLELRQAIENLMTRVPLTDLRIAATAVLIQKETGGNLAEVLNNTAEVIRERARLKRQVRVHTAHGRMTGWIIGLLPIALLVVLYIINPELESILWKREMGLKLMYVGGAMMLVGGLLIRKIIRMDV
jgi:tight adherence protein B